MAGINKNFPVADAIYDCFITDGALLNGDTKEDRMASELFTDDLSSCSDNTYEEFDEDLKYYYSLTVNNRKIRLRPGQKNNIKAFIQWIRDHIHL